MDKIRLIIKLKEETLKIDLLAEKAVVLSALIGSGQYEDLKKEFGSLEDAEGIVHNIDIDEVESFEFFKA